MQYGAQILYDETAQSPYFYYTDEAGRAHVVWFEDPRSIRARLALPAENDLVGVGFWDAMRPATANFMVLSALYRIVE